MKRNTPRTIFALALLVPVVAACAARSTDDDDETASDAEELRTDGAATCQRRPYELAGTCRRWGPASPLDTVGCSSGTAKRWTRWRVGTCMDVPGSVCENGARRRPTQEEARSLGPCPR
ncbi:MAG: hypothetical protein KF819_10645 [Labilithrix sp.]|nr:hypothetical protein [Labilithrix sp.]